MTRVMIYVTVTHMTEISRTDTHLQCYEGAFVCLRLRRLVTDVFICSALLPLQGKPFSTRRLHVAGLGLGLGLGLAVIV